MQTAGNSRVTPFGAEKEVVGELVFTTGMTGYIETLTDPSYYGQIVTQTFPLIGNYGMIEADMESKKPWGDRLYRKGKMRHALQFQVRRHDRRVP